MAWQPETRHVVETLKKAKDDGVKVNLLIGAGCSVEAGIPPAPTIVNDIEKEYPEYFEQCKDKTSYNAAMKCLSSGERRRLLGGYIEKAKMNWAHIAIAQLLKEGFVDRVLTVNFDPLVVNACAMVDKPPPVYDMAATPDFSLDFVPEGAVFYLHGQHTGYVILNEEQELKDHAAKIGPFLHRDGSYRVWLVVGYSGQSDSVFEVLKQFPRFDHRLYWVDLEAIPRPHLHNEYFNEERQCNETFLGGERFAYYLGGKNADEFFIELCQGLNCWPPKIIQKPFTYLKDKMQELALYPLREREGEPDITGETIKILEKVIARYEDPRRETRSLMMAGKYQEVAMKYPPGSSLPEGMEDDAAGAFNNWGNALLKQAIIKSGAEADTIFFDIYAKYEAALKIKPDYYEALNNWGIALSDQAKQKNGDEAELLFAEAISKFEVALQIEPKFDEALFNWGNILLYLGQLKKGLGEDIHFNEAISKYKATLEIKPDKHEALNNWGAALFYKARLKTSAESEALLDEAILKYKAALKIKPDKHEALNNWGNALTFQAQLKSGTESKALWEEAMEKYLAAEEIHPGAGSYDLACWHALNGDEEECRKWLEKSLDAGNLPNRKHLEEDTDLDNVRDKDWFKEFLEKIDN